MNRMPATCMEKECRVRGGRTREETMAAGMPCERARTRRVPAARPAHTAALYGVFGLLISSTFEACQLAELLMSVPGCPAAIVTLVSLVGLPVCSATLA